MLIGIDHFVVAVRDLEAASRSYAELGFTVVRGGRHPVGTHNALIAFADGAYLELIAFYAPSPGHYWWAPLQRGGGLVDFCLRTDDLLADTAAFREAGVEIDDPTPLTRVRPDGYELSWVLALPRGGYRGVAPFLIRDETPREERVPRETAQRNRVSGVGTVAVAVDDVATVRHWYAAVLRRAGQEVRRDDLDAAGVGFAIGPHTFEFVAPRGAAGPLAAWLRLHGPSPYAATLRTASGAGGPLDEAKSMGARLVLEALSSAGAPP
ncbi:MAG: VOC family protein [Candidatus Rokubacteria bacterium]|nr:VOC family protein [Candidatus Rokubacteria bacterium]